MKKKDFRQRQKQILRDFAGSAAKQEEDRLLFQQLLTSNLLQNVKTVGVTASLPLEIDTRPLIRYLWQKGKKVYLAKAHNDEARTQDFVRYRPETELKRSAFGVLEVADPMASINNEPDLLLVPGLAFAKKNGARLGFGGGYYDRFLAKHPAIKTVSLANSRMIFEEAQWPVAKTDIPVQIIITKNKIYRENKQKRVL